MALHLVTGYAGREHITANDEGSFNMATYSGGEFVFDRGTMFNATIVSNNAITIEDGEMLMQGRYIKLNPSTSEELSIDNGTSGKNRNDLICIRYEKNSVDGTESASLIVHKGTESSGNASDPEYVKGDITDGEDKINDYPLYRVVINGLNIVELVKLFDVQLTYTSREFLLTDRQDIEFSNKVCRINDARITEHSLADVYFSADTVNAASRANVGVESYDGYIELTAQLEPEKTLNASIIIRRFIL